MPIIVNTNVPSINAQRNLNQTTRALNKAMERLSSGLRINHASDDAAGLSIADGLATQVRGMTQAIRNAGDGMSLLGTVDGAAAQQVEILQRIRELTVQAANDINSSTNRAAIQEEINAQVAELTRIANTTEFNGTSLMTGAFAGKLLQVGAKSGQTIGVSLDDFRATALGSVATTTGTTAIDTTTTITGAGNVVINGATIANSANYISADSLSTTAKSGGAIAKAAAINASSATTKVTASVNASVYDYAAVAGGAVTIASTFTINGVSIYTGTGLTVQAADADGALRNLINTYSNQTGVVATLNAANGIRLTAADGRNVAAAFSSVVVGTIASRGTMSSQTFTGTISLTSNDAMTWTAAAANVIGLAITGSQAVDTTTSLTSVDVTSAATSATSLQRIDAALSQIGESQAKIGALTNRLQNTINNLEVSVENMSASESRIRDADFAAETAAMTRAQIIQQAGVAVLSQANLSPQAALVLLGA